METSSAKHDENGTSTDGAAKTIQPHGSLSNTTDLEEVKLGEQSVTEHLRTTLRPEARRVQALRGPGPSVKNLKYTNDTIVQEEQATNEFARAKETNKLTDRKRNYGGVVYEWGGAGGGVYSSGISTCVILVVREREYDNWFAVHLDDLIANGDFKEYRRKVRVIMRKGYPLSSTRVNM